MPVTINNDFGGNPMNGGQFLAPKLVSCDEDRQVLAKAGALGELLRFWQTDNLLI